MEHNFKVGDKVRRIRGFHGGMHEGDEDIVKRVSYSSIHLEKYCDGHSSEAFELVVKRKMVKPTHLVVWEEDTNPCKFFESEEKANEFVKELSEKSSVKKDSIILVEIKSTKKVTIQKSLRKSDYKI